MEGKIIDVNTYTITKATNNYRLCKKSNGELVLQRLYEELDKERQYIGESWYDIETVEEDK